MLIKGLIAMVVFSIVGAIVMFIGFRVIDRITPGDLSTELIQNKNTALAIVVASMILGISIIIAAAISG